MKLLHLPFSSFLPTVPSAKIQSKASEFRSSCSRLLRARFRVWLLESREKFHEFLIGDTFMQSLPVCIFPWKFAIILNFAPIIGGIIIFWKFCSGVLTESFRHQGCCFFQASAIIVSWKHSHCAAWKGPNWEVSASKLCLAPTLDTLRTNWGNATWRACASTQLLIEDSGNCTVVGMANDVLAGTEKLSDKLYLCHAAIPKYKTIKEHLQHFFDLCLLQRLNLAKTSLSRLCVIASNPLGLHGLIEHLCCIRSKVLHTCQNQFGNWGNKKLWERVRISIRVEIAIKRVLLYKYII